MGQLLRLASLAGVAMVLMAGGATAQDDAKAPKGGKAAKAEKAEKAVAEPAADSAAASPAAGDAAPAAVPMADFWVLEFRMQKVGIIQPTEGIHRGDVYWYMLYQIINKTGQDREAYISITARSNRGKTYAGICAPDIEAMIERKVGRSLWGKTDEQAALKQRAQKKEGADEKDKSDFNYFTFKNGKTMDCVAVFNKLDPGATSITITVEGLSNDLKLIEPESGPRQIESRIFVLQLERPGDEYAMNLDQFKEVKHRWSTKLIDLDKKPQKEKKEK